MKMTKGGDYLKTDATDLKGAIITIQDEGSIEVSDKYKYKNEDGTEGEFRKSLVFSVLFKGENKKLRMNMASKTACMEAWGDESKTWIGKKATIHILPTPNGDKKMIVLDPIIETAKTKEPEDIAWKD